MLTHKMCKTKRNVLLILTDQQRWDSVGYINPLIKTPNINKLAQESIICNTTYVQSPQCQPSRASLMTGRYPTAHKVWWNSIDLPQTEITIGNYLENSGYSTGFFGKAHISDQDKTVINKFGFQHHFLFEDWVNLNSQKSWDSSKINTLPLDEYYQAMSNPYWTGKLSNRGLHHEDIITDKFIDWWNKSSGPTFGVVSFVGPHPPYAAPSPFCDMYDPAEMSLPSNPSASTPTGHIMTSREWRDLKAQYYGMITWIDDNIGRILSSIDNDTIVVFTSDHGDILGDHGKFSKGLFAYDGNTRVPLLFRDNHLKPAEYDHIVQSIDILPTILQSLQIEVPCRIQGKSLLLGFQTGSKVNNYALSMIGHSERIRMIRYGNYKYWIKGNMEVLFDMLVDPTEQRNIAKSDLVELSNARNMLIRALIDAEDPVPEPSNMCRRR